LLLAPFSILGGRGNSGNISVLREAAAILGVSVASVACFRLLSGVASATVWRSAKRGQQDSPLAFGYRGGGVHILSPGDGELHSRLAGEVI
jgi:hypothetical protein